MTYVSYNQSKPVTPQEVTKLKQTLIPDIVIESFNELIAKNFNGSNATVLQKEIINTISTKWKLQNKYDLDTDRIFEEKWLDIEDIYSKAGWDVYYDKPAYCESYEPTFEFSKRRR